MKQRLLRILAVSLFASCIVSAASVTKGVEAASSCNGEPQSVYDNDMFYARHYLFYSNGAVRSVNNLANDTFHFNGDDFASNVGNLSDKLLGSVNYDETYNLSSEVGENNLSRLNTIFKMPAQKLQYLTNYTDEELKENGLLPEDDGDSNGNTFSSVNENVIDTGEANTSELVSAASYLINNNYLTMPREIVVNKTRSKYPVSASANLNTSWIDASVNGVSTNMKKSDLIMTLSKIYTGVKKSSAIVFKDYSERDGDVWSTKDPTEKIKHEEAESAASSCLNNPSLSGVDYYGSTDDYYGGDAHSPEPNEWSGETHKGVQFVGDYWVYYDPNVYELYLSEALADGIITTSDLAATEFKTDYVAKNTGEWGNGNVIVDDIPSDCLGYSHAVTNNSNKLVISSKEPNYFGAAEDMTVMEALKLIEAYMRANDENMSKTEESIIKYKLGLNVLSYLSEEDQSTVIYLIATGILDGTNSSLAGTLYDDATISRILPLLYRVANKNARADFSTIQLTDSETYWSSKDFSENTISVFTTDDDVIHETVSISSKVKRTKNKTTTASSDNLKGVTRGPFLVASAANELKTYKIVKYFDTKSVYCIGTTTIAKLAKALESSDAAEVESANKTMAKNCIKSITKKDDYEYKGKKHSVYAVEFEVNAQKQSTALALVERKYSVMSDLDKYKKTISGVTNIDKNGTTTTLVSQASLKQSFSNITVLEDKILMNSVTGTMAYLSYDSKMSIVGSQIISNGYASVVKAGDEVYYNLETIMPLLSKAYVDTIGSQISIVVTDIEHTHSKTISTTLADSEDYTLKAQYIKVYQQYDQTSNTDGDAGEDDHNGFSCVATSDAKKSLKDANENYSVGYFVKLNSLSTAANKLTKSFSVAYNDTLIKGTIIVDLQYVAPDIGTFGDWLSTQVMSDDVFTYQDAAEILNTAPDKLVNSGKYTQKIDSLTSVEKSALNAWWYSNYGMSNALCNFMMETDGYLYVTSGYVCPSVTVLFDSVGNKSFDDWCASGKKNAAAIQNNVLQQIFHEFSLGDDYLKYNGGTKDMFWHNFYQCDASTPDYSKLGFTSVTKNVSNTIQASRRFEIYYQPGKKALKGNKVGKLSGDQLFKTYGTRYAVSASGCIYENIDTLGNPKHPMFSYTCKHKGGENSTIATLKLNSRTSNIISINRGQKVFVNGSTIAKYDSVLESKSMKYYGIFVPRVDSSSNVSVHSVSITLAKDVDDATSYVPMSKEIGENHDSYYKLNSSDFYNKRYLSSYRTIFGQSDTCPSHDTIKNIIKSKNANLFLDPTMYKDNKQLMREIFGRQTVYIYTDKGKTDGLTGAGKIYKWDNDNAKLEKCDSSVITEIALSGREIICAVPVYLAPCDSFFLQTSSTGSVILGSNAFNKALNYMQFDLTSLNNQLIETYLNEQQGVIGINKIAEGATVTIGDTTWVKKGNWLQSKPISDSQNAKAMIDTPDNIRVYSNVLFGGIYLNKQGHRYSLQAYVKDIKLGSCVGSKKQYRKGVLYLDGNTVKIRKGDKIKKATSKMSPQYLSVKCKFDDSVLVRPTDETQLHYTLVCNTNTGMISSANYPFFDAEASWDKTNKQLFTVSTTKFKPSSAYDSSKKTFMQEFRALLVEDSWNFIWMIIVLAASYLLVMSWIAYGILTMGVGRAGFEALTLRDRSGSRKGFDIIKFVTFGMYSLDKPLSLARTVIITFGCCIVILTIITLIF